MSNQIERFELIDLTKVKKDSPVGKWLVKVRYGLFILTCIILALIAYTFGFTLIFWWSVVAVIPVWLIVIPLLIAVLMPTAVIVAEHDYQLGKDPNTLIGKLRQEFQHHLEIFSDENVLQLSRDHALDKAKDTLIKLGKLKGLDEKETLTPEYHLIRYSNNNRTFEHDGHEFTVPDGAICISFNDRKFHIFEFVNNEDVKNISEDAYEKTISLEPPILVTHKSSGNKYKITYPTMYVKFKE